MAPSERRERIAKRLRSHKAELLPQIVKYVRRECPLYIDVTDLEIEESLTQNIEMCIRAGVTQVGNSDSHLRNWAQISRSRFEKSVPMEEIFQTYRYSIELIVEVLIHLFSASGFTAKQQTTAVTDVWKSANAYTVVLAEIYNHHQKTHASQNQTQKAILFDAIRAGTPVDSRIQEAAEFFRLSQRTSYSYFIATLTNGSTLPAYEVLQTLESRLTNGRGLCIATSSTIEGFATDTLHFPKASISFGPPRRLDELHYSRNIATQIARTSIAKDAGTHQISDVGWRIAVISHPEVLLPYKEKYVSPLNRANVDAANILRSLEAYLAHDTNVASTAHALHCHPNTLRYRLARFEELTSCTIHDSETRVELAWLFEAIRTHHPDLL